MAQHDGVIDNGPGLAVRTDINALAQALLTQNSGPVEPTTKYAGQVWLDTTVAPDGLLRQRNQANTGWVGLQAGQQVTIVEKFITASTTWAKPAGLRFLAVEIMGAGGSGSGTLATAAGQYNAGGGGGAGGFGRKLYAASDLGASVSITIGAAGSGGAGSSGVAGGATIFSGLTAGGGGGGANTGLVGPAMTQAAGGAGGACTGFTINGKGANGSQGIAYFCNLAAYCWRGIGASSAYGQGGPGEIGVSSGAGASGYGAGGGGAAVTASVAAQAGGPGAPAFVHLWEIY